MKLSELFLDALENEVRANFENLYGLEQRLEAVLAQTNAMWPNVEIAASEYLPYMAQRVPGLSVDQVLQVEFNRDLYIACACVKGNEQAISEFERSYSPDLDKVYHKSATNVVDRLDFRQQVWERILVANDGPPRIASYRGRGSLSAWLRMTGRRVLLNLIRDAKRTPREVTEDRLLATIANRTLDTMHLLDKEQQRQLFKEVLSAALEELVPEDRNFLRYRFIDGASMEEVARLLGIHRVSASRRLARIQKHIMSQVRAGLCQNADEDASLHGALGRVQSDLELSLSRLLT